MSEEPASFDPNKINEVDPARLIFPLRYAREAFDAPEGAEVTEFERSPEGYMEIEWQYKDVQRALNLDFDHLTSRMSRKELEDAAAVPVAVLNKSRADLENPAPELELGNLDDTFLRRIIRPDWQEQVPTDTEPKTEETWQGFLAKYPEHMQVNLTELRLLDGKMRVLSNDPELRGAIQEMRAERVEVMRAASGFLSADRKIEQLSRRVSEFYRAAGSSNRALTPAERRRIDNLQAQQHQVRAERGRFLTSDAILEDVKVEIKRRIDIDRRRDFERGLVMTEQMKNIIDELLPSLAQGKPALLVGETGGAKTALAEYIAREYFGSEPEFISGYGDVNSYQLMGKPGLSNDGGTPVTDFMPGPVVRAMESGRPLILDEINAMPPEFLKRLNKIMQLRPGDKLVVQEDSGLEVTIKPGFFIIATANEKSKRYKGVQDLSVEFQNRFGANVIRVHYPDNDTVYGQPPVENSLIARAALTDRSGNMVPGVGADELERFVRACHVTQQVFSGNHGGGFENYTSAERIADSKPGLEEAVLAPRTMVDLLDKVRDSHGNLTLEQVLDRFVSGIKNVEDRKQMLFILRGHDFLKAPEAPDPFAAP